MLSIFFFNDTATTEIYTLSLHDALPIYIDYRYAQKSDQVSKAELRRALESVEKFTKSISETERSEEHTSELQSHLNLVCRLLLEKKKMLQVPVPQIH